MNHTETAENPRPIRAFLLSSTCNIPIRHGVSHQKAPAPAVQQPNFYFALEQAYAYISANLFFFRKSASFHDNQQVEQLQSR